MLNLDAHEDRKSLQGMSVFKGRMEHLKCSEVDSLFDAFRLELWHLAWG